MSQFSITVNGEAVELSVDGNTPLLWVLREQLRLLGTKFGCGMGLCGACTVHLDGSPIRSCSFPIQAAQGRQITTIEGLSDGDDLHPLQSSWLEFNVPQCGYCQSGQLMSAAALLANNPQPSDQEIDEAMSGNICRCGTYPRIRAAIRHTADNAVQQFDPKQTNESEPMEAQS
ncbi:(2Fe-2S)-binding protein [Spongiibacter nanhainus]|uniref:(2Fe-2S)-binding protein n=1 Tax=Spongiibacter nanhainus TaxID=2794344 RepID=A0A7T4UNL0_9GAMM|nr:(2Fe-2S)-binding protein [Spongiibacter nanhainus]QQD16656.1 (2Fe-2S)-binding protein [Spongiibacter nanhainus]